jgi:hypothetical protein
MMIDRNANGIRLWNNVMHSGGILTTRNAQHMNFLQEFLIFLEENIACMISIEQSNDHTADKRPSFSEVSLERKCQEPMIRRKVLLHTIL